jgi:hypothetical protein
MTVLLKNLCTVLFQFDLLKLEVKHAWIIARWTVRLRRSLLNPRGNELGWTLIRFDPQACNLNAPPPYHHLLPPEKIFCNRVPRKAGLWTITGIPFSAKYDGMLAMAKSGWHEESQVFSHDLSSWKSLMMLAWLIDWFIIMLPLRLSASGRRINIIMLTNETSFRPCSVSLYLSLPRNLIGPLDPSSPVRLMAATWSLPDRGWWRQWDCFLFRSCLFTYSYSSVEELRLSCPLL